MSKKKNILITGSSRGIGFLTAKELLSRGHRVIATMRDPMGRNLEASNALVALEKELGARLEIVELDVTKDHSIEQILPALNQEKDIDVLINNVGVMPVGVTEAFSVRQLQEFFDVNFFSVVRTSRALLPFMRQRNTGLIINLSSTAGRLAYPYFGVYCATKWAMEAYTEAMDCELEGSGVRSILVQPSGHNTDLVSTSPGPDDTVCVDSYGARSNGGEHLLGMFKSMFEDNEPINDPQNVAEKLADLVEMKQPPLRTTLGIDQGVQEINDAVLPFQNAIIDLLKPVYAR